jgi:hypothetical protein
MISVIPGNDIVRNAIRRRGYGFVRGRAISLSPDIENYWEELRGDWSHLPDDACLKDKGRYRFRRYDRFYLLPVSGELLPLPHTAFFQGKGFNKLHGGIKREFAALRNLTFKNIFLRELIKFDFLQFSPQSATIQKPWEVGIHEIRIVAKPAAPGKPTPEGPHRDGYKFIAMHLIRRKNILGGVTTIFDNRKQTLQAVTLLDPLDSVYVEDARINHAVTPIYLAKNKARGIRDMLIVTYDYYPRLEPA